MQPLFSSILVLALFAGGSYAADDVAGAVAGAVKSIDKSSKTIVLKTKDRAEETFRFVDKTVAHGGEATAAGAKDAYSGIKEGDELVVHYTVKGAVKTADEVDHIGKDGLKTAVVSVRGIDRGAKTVALKTADGGEETYHVTDRALKEIGKNFDKAGNVTVYYSDDAGKKIVHFLKG